MCCVLLFFVVIQFPVSIVDRFSAKVHDGLKVLCRSLQLVGDVPLHVQCRMELDTT